MPPPFSSALERFLSKTLPSLDDGACIEWQAHIDRNGYGQFWFDRGWWKAHRFAYAARIGPIPPGHEIHHLCGNKACVCPAHLEPLTPQEHYETEKTLRLDALRRARSLAKPRKTTTHCPRNHPYNAENTRHYRGSRFCRACMREYNRTMREKRKALAAC